MFGIGNRWHRKVGFQIPSNGGGERRGVVTNSSTAICGQLILVSKLVRATAESWEEIQPHHGGAEHSLGSWARGSDHISAGDGGSPDPTPPAGH